jgi:hypothetical protein
MASSVVGVAGALAIVGPGANPVAAAPASGTVVRSYKVEITGSATGTSIPLTESVTWTTTYPNVRITVLPTPRFGRWPAGHLIKGTASGETRFTYRYDDGGEFTRCSWTDTLTRGARLLVEGRPGLMRVAGGRTSWFELKIVDMPTTFDGVPIPCESVRSALGSVPFENPAAGVGGNLGSGANGTSVYVTHWFWKPQPRNRLSVPLRQLAAGQTFSLSFRGEELTEVGGSPPETRSGTTRITFTRR